MVKEQQTYFFKPKGLGSFFHRKITLPRERGGVWVKDLLLRCVPALQDLPPDQMKPGTLLLRILRMEGQKGRRAQKGCRITKLSQLLQCFLFDAKKPPPPPQQHHRQEEEPKHKQLPTVTPSFQPHYP